MDEETPQHEVTRLIQAASASDHGAADQLLALVYDQLRKIAQQRMNEERRDHTLQATALVHEAYLRLVGDTEVQWQGRGHFFAVAAEAMRKILIDQARARVTGKRGGDGAGPPKRVPLDALELASAANPEEILVLNEAISRLEKEDPQAGEVVRLRFFAGLSLDETAAALGTSPSSVDREWAYARARLRRLLQD